jgi:hypothetical protein
VIKIHAYGSQLDNFSKRSIQKFNLEKNVLSHGRLEKDRKTGLSGREQIAIKMMEADVLILLHGTTPWCAEYIPSKFYEYLWVPRPIWGLTYENLQLNGLLEDRGSYISNSTDPISIQAQLERIWVNWKNQKLVEPIFKPISVEDAVQQILNKAFGSS